MRFSFFRCYIIINLKFTFILDLWHFFYENMAFEDFWRKPKFGLIGKRKNNSSIFKENKIKNDKNWVNKILLWVKINQF